MNDVLIGQTLVQFFAPSDFGRKISDIFISLVSDTHSQKAYSQIFLIAVLFSSLKTTTNKIFWLIWSWLLQYSSTSVTHFGKDYVAV